MINIFKKEITIHDKDGKRFDLTITNKWSSTWPYFSICSQSWQWQFNPKSDIQQQLLNIWNIYHIKNIDKLPNDFNETLFNLIDKLIEEEDEYNERKITIEDICNEEFIEHANEKCEWEVEKLMAACLHCWVSWSWLGNVTCNWNWNYWDIEWFEYYIYTDKEANEAHRDYIENLVDDIWFEWLRWWKDIYVDIDEDGWITISKKIEIWPDERWNALAWYDWYENEIYINWTTYYLYRNN